MVGQRRLWPKTGVFGVKGCLAAARGTVGEKMVRQVPEAVEPCGHADGDSSGLDRGCDGFLGKFYEFDRGCWGVRPIRCYLQHIHVNAFVQGLSECGRPSNL